ncbi:YcjF family protein [Parasulfitobacter algicola]|uniref:TIGR01620 family protein n=1 Tax=Parasulfitobacter algicola TaxID=2614809 RepID=A0ABX2IKJ1_9RHOB|nr:TIGR01620 family protein [Sulfitobacter algicola]NSX53399.1 TIGR01620 family protein [Sulfitobacter algicola]
MTQKSTGPVLIELEETSDKTPSTVPPVPDVQMPTPTGQAMQTMAALAAREPSRLGKWFWSVLGALFTFILSLAAWDFITGLLDRNPILGMAALGLTGLFILILTIIALRELAAFSRLGRLDRVHKAAEAALAANDLDGARHVIKQLETLYKSREDTQWGREKLTERQGDMFDADGLLGLAENELLTPLDTAATQQVEAAARQVAMVTALVPLALADVFTALTANLRMIRRIAEVYGGRAGTLGSWRLTRAVLTHLVATGAVAVGDDMIGSVAGGGVLSKISRRFGEGLINGALTARVGVAAIEVCRPLPFHTRKRPSVSGIVKRSLTGLFGSANKE